MELDTPSWWFRTRETDDSETPAHLATSVIVGFEWVFAKTAPNVGQAR